MKLEQPRIRGAGDLEQRIGYLERYLYRLTAQLQMELSALQQAQNDPKGGKNQ